MCLAIPGKIVEIDDSNELMRMSQVDFGGVVRQISLAYVPEAKVGDYILVHTGFAINVIDEKSAQETLELLTELAGYQDDLEATA